MNRKRVCEFGISALAWADDKHARRIDLQSSTNGWHNIRPASQCRKMRTVRLFLPVEATSRFRKCSKTRLAIKLSLVPKIDELCDMLIGYARVSTSEQDLGLQLDALTKAGCEKIFDDIASGAKDEWKGLNAALEFMRTGDTLVVWNRSPSWRKEK